jgi:adenylate kinase
MGLYIVVMGVQGAGKGTQAQFIMQEFGIPHISTGDLFRAMKTLDTPLAREVQDLMAAGNLIPDDLTNRIVDERLKQPDAQKGAIFDGYPRTVPQAKSFDDLLAQKGERINLVLLLELDREEAIKRLEGRRYSQDGKRVYNIHFDPPKQEGIDDVDGLPLVQRADDTREGIEKRINAYYVQTMPLIEYYENAGLLIRVNADHPIEEVHAEVQNAVKAIKA